eukprot:3510689-Lingulodinium_polyedra.AAC.1
MQSVEEKRQAPACEQQVSIFTGPNLAFGWSSVRIWSDLVQVWLGFLVRIWDVVLVRFDMVR